MKVVHNTGTDRVFDIIGTEIQHQPLLDVVSPSFSLFAFSEVRTQWVAPRQASGPQSGIANV